jgi:hypothetical protein
VIGPGQWTTGAVVSTMVTTWLKKELLPQQSVAFQVRVATFGQVPLVTVLKTETVTLLPQHVSVAVGGSKVHWLPHSTVLAG